MNETMTTEAEELLMDVIKQKGDFIKETQSSDKENIQATEQFIKCMTIYRDLQKDADEGYLEQQRIDNEKKKNEDEAFAARKAEMQKDLFDKFRIGLEAASLTLTGLGLIMSFINLHEYQEINLESVMTNKDAVKAADSLFGTMFRRLG